MPQFVHRSPTGRHLGWLSRLAITNKAGVNICAYVFCVTVKFSFLWDKCLEFFSAFKDKSIIGRNHTLLTTGP